MFCLASLLRVCWNHSSGQAGQHGHRRLLGSFFSHASTQLPLYAICAGCKEPWAEQLSPRLYLPTPQALPNGHVSPALYVALRVLGATDAELASWRSIGDALRLPTAAAGGGGSGGSGGGGQRGAGSKDKEEEGPGEEEEEGEEGEPQLGAVQVWRVLGKDGQPLAEAQAAAGEEEAASEAGSQGYAALLPAAMWQLLAAEVRQRQTACDAPLEADLEHLAQLEGQQAQQGAQQAQQPPSEAEAAERAALLLRITEKEVLRDLLTALQRRLAAMGASEAVAADGAAKQAGMAAPGRGRGKARGRQAATAGEGAPAPGGSAAARKRKQR